MRRVDCLMPNRKNENRNTERRNRERKKKERIIYLIICFNKLKKKKDFRTQAFYVINIYIYKKEKKNMIYEMKRLTKQWRFYVLPM